jgi:hypothetical protein
VATNSVSAEANGDVATVCAVNLLAAILTNVLHEGVGHAATALLTGTKSGLLTTVAWSSGGGRAVRASVVEVLHSERSRSPPTIRWR